MLLASASIIDPKFPSLAGRCVSPVVSIRLVAGIVLLVDVGSAVVRSEAVVIITVAMMTGCTRCLMRLDASGTAADAVIEVSRYKVYWYLLWRSRGYI